jgi:hypothetical protein
MLPQTANDGVCQPEPPHVFEYVKAVKREEKAPDGLFDNLRIIPEREFLQMISTG